MAILVKKHRISCIATEVAAALATGAAGIIGAGVTAGASAGSTKLARRENFQYNEAAARNADARTRALYQDLYSPQAKMQQLKEAGLNPALMYGTSGIAGSNTSTQGAMGQGSNGVAAAPMPNFDVVGMARAAKEIDFMEAQARNLDADTDLKVLQYVNDPEMQEAIKTRGDTLRKANEALSIGVKDAFHTFQDNLVKAGYKELANSMTISESNTDGEGHNFTVAYSVGGSQSSGEGFEKGGGGTLDISVGLKKTGVGVGGNGHHGEHHEQGNSYNVSQSVGGGENFIKTVSHMKSESHQEAGYSTSPEELLKNFIQAVDAQESIYNRAREDAEETYQKQLDHVMERKREYIPHERKKRY